MPMCLQRVWPWSPFAHPGPWEHSARVQRHSVFHELQNYLHALRAPATPGFFNCLSWHARAQRMLNVYLRNERYLARDPDSPYFRRETARCGKILHTALKDFSKHYRNHPRFRDVDPIVRRSIFALRMRGRDFGQSW
ncbi:MAG: hypothetical protein EOO62_38425 [Hymenobacter sp.]|nr:MAG: hypothetical protein EOO62_38425 [Hymenobacter sp.]